jgi:hypothetical protein
LLFGLCIAEINGLWLLLFFMLFMIWTPIQGECIQLTLSFKPIFSWKICFLMCLQLKLEPNEITLGSCLCWVRFLYTIIFDNLPLQLLLLPMNSCFGCLKLGISKSVWRHLENWWVCFASFEVAKLIFASSEIKMGISPCRRISDFWPVGIDPRLKYWWQHANFLSMQFNIWNRL